MEKLLSPEKRAGTNSILRTTAESWIEVPVSYLPQETAKFSSDSYLRIGPIPQNTPVNLLASADLDFSNPRNGDRLKLIAEVQAELFRIKVEKLNLEQVQQELLKLGPDLLKINKCPDFIEDRGHYYGTSLSDADRQALVEFMKTF